MSKEQITQVETNLVKPSNFVQVPRLAFELDVYAFKLLCVYLDMPNNWMTNKKISTLIGCSVNKMKQARTTLQEKGYVKVYQRDKATTIVKLCEVTLWTKNSDDRYKKLINWVSSDDTPLSSDDTPLSPDDTPPYQHVTPSNTKDSNTKKDTSALSNDNAKAPTSSRKKRDDKLDLLVSSICDDLDLATKSTWSNARKVLKEINEVIQGKFGNDVTIEQLRSIIQFVQSEASAHSWQYSINSITSNGRLSRWYIMQSKMPKSISIEDAKKLYRGGGMVVFEDGARYLQHSYMGYTWRTDLNGEAL